MKWRYLRAEIATGHILDVEMKLASDNEQEGYTIFDSFEDALCEVTFVAKMRENIEFLIYDSSNNLLRLIKKDDLARPLD